MAWLVGFGLCGGQVLCAQPAAGDPPAAWLVVDADDDDHDGRPDHRQTTAIPVEDLLPVPPRLRAGSTAIAVRGPRARLVHQGIARRTLGPPLPHGPIFVQGLLPGRAALIFTRPQGNTTWVVAIASIRYLDGHSRLLSPARQDAAISLFITNGPSLPFAGDAPGPSPDRRNLRLQLSAPGLSGPAPALILAAHGPGAQRRPVSAGSGQALIQVPLHRLGSGSEFRSAFLRLVADRADREAPGVRGRVLQVGLLDRLRASWTSPGGTVLSQDILVGVRDPGWTAHSAYLARLVLHILRTHAGGPPVIGRGAASARAIMRDQLRVAGEAWAQCGIAFEADSAGLTAPPVPALLSIADGNGLPARGDGVIALRAAGRPIGPLPTVAGHKPVDTAMGLAGLIEGAGFHAEVTVNPRARFGVFESADIVVRGQDGDLVHLQPLPGVPLCTDSRQRLAIGRVDLGDGLTPFDNMNARAGTLEERALIKSLADRDPATIDVFIVNRFSGGTRQGEAFIERGGGPLMNTVVLDREGLRQRDSAWTLAHELGHVLLDEPLHPDNVGSDRPWQLMDADSDRGTVYGPKRLSEDDCRRALHRSGPQAVPALLQPLSR